MFAVDLFLALALVTPAFANHDATNSSISLTVSTVTVTASNDNSTTPASQTISTTASGNLTSTATSALASSTFISTGTNFTNKATGKDTKRGISFPAANNPADFLNINQSHSVVSWTYDWSVIPPDYLTDTGVEYVPMQWGSGNIESLGSIMAKTGAKTLLAFNEPDFDEQSNMDPTYAAQLWMQYIEPLKEKGVRLGGPAVTGSPTGRPWLTDFFNACTNCTIDFLPLHWYGVGSAGFYDYLWSVHGQWPDMKIWITEYADTESTYDEVLDFMNSTAGYLEGLDWVERYAWFGYNRPEKGTFYNLLNDDGGLNQLGEFYIGAKSVEKSGGATHSVTVVSGPVSTFATVSVGTNVATPTFSGAQSFAIPPSSHAVLVLAFIYLLMRWL